MPKHLLYTAGVALAVIVISDMLRPKGARLMDKGAKNENKLLFDPASAPVT